MRSAAYKQLNDFLRNARHGWEVLKKVFMSCTCAECAVKGAIASYFADSASVRDACSAAFVREAVPMVFIRVGLSASLFGSICLFASASAAPTRSPNEDSLI